MCNNAASYEKYFFIRTFLNYRTAPTKSHKDYIQKDSDTPKDSKSGCFSDWERESLTNIIIGNCQLVLYQKGKFICDGEFKNQGSRSPEVERAVDLR